MLSLGCNHKEITMNVVILLGYSNPWEMLFDVHDDWDTIFAISDDWGELGI